MGRPKEGYRVLKHEGFEYNTLNDLMTKIQELVDNNEIYLVQKDIAGGPGGYGLIVAYYMAQTPVITRFYPEDDDTAIPVDAVLQLDFEEEIKLDASGVIELRELVGDAVVPATVAVDGRKLTITPTSSLTPLTGYYVYIDDKKVIDKQGNTFAGLTGYANNTAWNFTTA